MTGLIKYFKVKSELAPYMASSLFHYEKISIIKVLIFHVSNDLQMSQKLIRNGCTARDRQSKFLVCLVAHHRFSLYIHPPV